MKRFPLRACALLLVGLLAGTGVHAQSTKTITETVPLDRDGEVIIDTYKGSIAVTTWARDAVEIHVRIEPDDDPELVAGTEVHIRGGGGRLTLESDYEEAKSRNSGRWGGQSYSLPYVHYTIKMPATARLRIDDYKSEITVDGLRADLRLETYKGVVEVRDLSGALQLETYKGDVTVDFSTLAGHSSFDTYKGTIDIRLPPTAGFDLDADLGRRGDLDADFRMRDLRRNDHDYRGAVQGGGPRLQLETDKGSYRLRTR